jgi:hypothetical protein
MRRRIVSMVFIDLRIPVFKVIARVGGPSDGPFNEAA